MERNPARTMPVEGVEHPEHRVEFALGPGDLRVVRFGISPGHELAHAVRALLRPGRHPLLWGWLRTVRDRLPAQSFALLAAVIGEDGYVPDFLTATPSWDLTPEAEVEALRSASPETMRVDLEKQIRRSEGASRRTLCGMREEPERARAVIADASQEVWDAALAHVWPQLERLLRADVTQRSRTIAASGLSGMAGALHPDVSWDDGAVRVRLRRHSETVDCRGSGLVLVPSVMSWRGCMVLTEPPAQPTLFYPARGVTAEWARDAADVEKALGALIGPARAGILREADEPRSTSEVARDAGIALSTASHHLAVLRAAGLVASERDGTRMLHLRTPLGESLLHGGL